MLESPVPFRENSDELIEFKILGTGNGLPYEISLGRESHRIHWKWRPQLYIFKVLREQNNLRTGNPKFSNLIRPTAWSLWSLFRLIRNGISPAKGLLSGRAAVIVTKSNVGKPSFIRSNRSLLMMRSIGKHGFLLNDYSNFVEVKLSRNPSAAVITDFSINVRPNKLLMRLRSRALVKLLPLLMDKKMAFVFTRKIVSVFPDWHPFKCHFLNDTSFVLIDRKVVDVKALNIHQKNELICCSNEDDVILHSGKNLIINENQIFASTDNSEDYFLNRNWPAHIWNVKELDRAKIPSTLTAHGQKDGTFVSAANNLYHFLEDSLPQIEINNSLYPSPPLFVGGNIDPILEEIATASSTAPVTFLRDEEQIRFRKLRFFFLSDYRARLARGERIDVKEHAELIASGIYRVKLQKASTRTTSLKIFIIRKRGLQRRLVNMRPLRKELEERGFIFVVFENLTLSQRLNILEECSVLIGESGAGLAHAYFLNSLARIIEIRHPLMRGSLEHLTLSIATGIDYEVVDGLHSSRADKVVYGKDSFRVDVDCLLKAIDGRGNAKP